MRGDLSRLKKTARIYLRAAATEQTPVLVVAIDADDRSVEARRQDVVHALEACIADIGQSAARVDGGLVMDATAIHPLVWPCQPFAVTPGVPPCGTLEQLVCGVLAHREADRGRQVDAFLKTAGDGTGWRRPADVGKSHAWAWMAHRQPVDECERFFESPWEDAGLAADLEAAMGPRAARVMQALLA